MKLKLNTIASVQVGQSFRSRLEREETGGVAVIQMKDLTGDNRVKLDNLTMVALKALPAQHQIQKGDLVFRSRGQNNTAVCLDKDIGPAVVAAPLMKISLGSERILSEYLLWYLNQPVSQSYFRQHSEGTAQKKISKPVLENLPVDVPSIEYQQQIVALANLAHQEQGLLTELAERRQRYMQGILMQMASGARQ